MGACTIRAVGSSPIYSTCTGSRRPGSSGRLRVPTRRRRRSARSATRRTGSSRYAGAVRPRPVPRFAPDSLNLDAARSCHRCFHATTTRSPTWTAPRWSCGPTGRAATGSRRRSRRACSIPSDRSSGPSTTHRSPRTWRPSCRTSPSTTAGGAALGRRSVRCSPSTGHALSVWRGQPTGSLGRSIADPRRWVLCHADLHAGNVLVGPDGPVTILDWDSAMFAPRERDLMFPGAAVAGTWTGDEHVTSFLRGYNAGALGVPSRPRGRGVLPLRPDLRGHRHHDEGHLRPNQPEPSRFRTEPHDAVRARRRGGSRRAQPAPTRTAVHVSRRMKPPRETRWALWPRVRSERRVIPAFRRPTAVRPAVRGHVCCRVLPSILPPAPPSARPQRRQDLGHLTDPERSRQHEEGADRRHRGDQERGGADQLARLPRLDPPDRPSDDQRPRPDGEGQSHREPRQRSQGQVSEVALQPTQRDDDPDRIGEGVAPGQASRDEGVDADDGGQADAQRDVEYGDQHLEEERRPRVLHGVEGALADVLTRERDQSDGQHHQRPAGEVGVALTRTESEHEASDRETEDHQADRRRQQCGQREPQRPGHLGRGAGPVTGERQAGSAGQHRGR